jgi:hypothetical protein
MNLQDESAKTRLDGWALLSGSEELAQAAREGYEYADGLLRSLGGLLLQVIAAELGHGSVEELGAVTIQLGDDERSRFAWEPRKSPSAAAFEVDRHVKTVLARPQKDDFYPPDLKVEQLPIQRVVETCGRAYIKQTAVVVILTHPCARPCALIVPAEPS